MMWAEIAKDLTDTEKSDLVAVAKKWQGDYAWSRSEVAREFYVNHNVFPTFLADVDRRWALCQEIIDVAS